MMRLAIVSLLAILVACQEPASQQAAAPAPSKPAPQAKQAMLSVGDVLGWRSAYGDLLGKTKDAAVERFGQPSTEDATGVWTWEPGPKTSNRMVTIAFAPKLATEVKVYAAGDEKVDPLDVLKRAPEFNLGTGTYKDSVTSYFVAETKDGRNALQFDVGGDQVTFNAAIFSAGKPSATTSRDRRHR